jgi:hypothetical protein
VTLVSLERGLGRLAGLDWRRETIYVLTAAMEVAWFAPWYLAFMPMEAQLPPERTAVGLFLVMVLPTYGARALLRLNLKPRLHGVALAALLVVNCLLAMRVFLYAGQAYAGLDWLQETLRDVLDIYQFMPDWFVVVLSTLFLWWRGVRLGQRLPSVRGITLGFYAGIVSFIAFVLLVSLATREDPSFFIPAFFFYSLMALAATRMAEMRGRRGALRSPFGLFWLLSIALAALSVVFLAVSLGALLTGGDFKSALRWIQPLLLLVGLVLGLVLLLLRALADWVLGFVRSLGVEGDTRPLAEFLDGLNDLVADGSGTTIQAPPGLGAVRLLLLGGLVLGLGVWVMLMVRRQAWGEREQDDEGQESMLSAGLLLENLRQLVSAGRGRLAAALGLVERSGWRGLFAALTIRRIYAQMLRLAAARDFPRAASQTPYEFERTAARAFPDARSEVRVITQAYVAVHYGEVPETDAELQEIRACWERLKDSLRTKGTRLP